MRRRRQNESGFALLLVFLMAAILAITLYKEIPRVAFDTQRQKEQMLIERGEQYKRAIQLFYRENKRWPAKLEDLENTNNKHYLRKRYVDPMTGKDEWRVIRIVNGVLVDSKVQNAQNAQQQKQGPTSTYIGEVAGLGQQMVNQGQTAANPALRRRGSDLGVPGEPGGPGDPNAPPGMQPQPGAIQGGMVNPGQMQPGMPGATGVTGIVGQPGVTGIAGMPGQTGMPGMPPGMPVMPGQPVGIAGAVGVTGRTGMPGGASAPPAAGSSYLGSGSTYLGGGSSTAAQPVNPINVMRGQPGMPPIQPGMPGTSGFPPGVPANSQTFGGAPAYPITAGANGMPPNFQQPGTTINPQAQGAAAAMIGQILTQPRPGGMPQANSAGVGIGGSGIAGFASTADQDSIMVYNDQQNYGLWEFVFDPAKVKPLANPNGGTVGTPASQLGSPMGQQLGTPMNTPFGQQPQSPFGQQPQSPFGQQGASPFGQQGASPFGQPGRGGRQ